MKQIQDLYQNIIKNGHDQISMKQQREFRDKSGDLREMQQIKLDLEALKKTNNEYHQRNSSDDQSFQFSHPVYHSNMFDNVTNTITSLGSNVTIKNQIPQSSKVIQHDSQFENDTQTQQKMPHRISVDKQKEKATTSQNGYITSKRSSNKSNHSKSSLTQTK